ncbi:MAG TPA: TylF/MycF/NovP-related O-methyltransferase [Gemmataceae bacterium]|nr:TylF/MycF/NovP-related O-methyltransferase [Gemmataceae bacterium]
MVRFDGFKKTGPDAGIEDQIVQHCERHGLSPLEAVKMFPVLARRQWLKRFLAHTELFKLSLDVPGDVADLGVFRGLSLMTWANLLEAYCIGDRTKVVYGFDNWAGFTELRPEDGKPIESAHKTVGGFDASDSWDELNDAIRIFDADRFVPWKSRVKLVRGNIEESVGKFVTENSGVRFSFVHFDCDLYAPTKSALEAIWPRVCHGGVVLFDEYAIADWAGETRAVDEYFADAPGVRVKTLPWTNAPAGYIIKP